MTKSYEFVTLDVFTDRRFGGNPLAVVADARGLDTPTMQALAGEFNLSETTFVLPPMTLTIPPRYASSHHPLKSALPAIPTSAPPGCWQPRGSTQMVA